MAETPNSFISPQHVKTSTAVVTSAKADYTTSPTGAVRLLAAASVPNGALVKRLTAISKGGNPSANQLQLYRSYDSGVTVVFADSSVLPAYSLATSTAVTKGDFGYTNDSPLRVQAGEELWVATAATLAAGVVFIVEYEAF